MASGWVLVEQSALVLVEQSAPWATQQPIGVRALQSTSLALTVLPAQQILFVRSLLELLPLLLVADFFGVVQVLPFVHRLSSVVCLGVLASFCDMPAQLHQQVLPLAA
jgi:hypothetical protein